MFAMNRMTMNDIQWVDLGPWSRTLSEKLAILPLWFKAGIQGARKHMTTTERLKTPQFAAIAMLWSRNQKPCKHGSRLVRSRSLEDLLFIISNFGIFDTQSFSSLPWLGGREANEYSDWRPMSFRPAANILLMVHVAPSMRILRTILNITNPSPSTTASRTKYSEEVRLSPLSMATSCRFLVKADLRRLDLESQLGMLGWPKSADRDSSWFLMPDEQCSTPLLVEDFRGLYYPKKLGIIIQ